MTNWKNKYPISTITGTTYDELVEFIDGLIKEAIQEERLRLIKLNEHIKI